MSLFFLFAILGDSKYFSLETVDLIFGNSQMFFWNKGAKIAEGRPLSSMRESLFTEGFTASDDAVWSD